MKILVVDDQARRYGRLVSALEPYGVDRSMIEICSSANEARDKLSASQYDLLILDVLIPLWSEEEPSVQNSLDLLTELHEGDDLNKPARILGITADLSIVGSASKSFEENTWTIVKYSESNDEWITRAVNCVRYILDEQRNPKCSVEHHVDLVIVCALASPELEEILKLPWNWSVPRPIDDQTFVHDGNFQSGTRTIKVCAASTPRMGMVATALRSANLISLLRPKLIAMCGICAGVKGKVEIGDVLLADPAWDFQSGKRVEGAQFAISPHQIYASTLVRTHVEQIRADTAALAKIALDFGGDPRRAPKLLIGPVACGSAVLADGQIVNEIKSQHRDLIGVEMEIYGMYSAADVSLHPQPHAFALKGVCDFADPDKGDSQQRYAAFSSARILQLLMERFGMRLLPA